MRIKYGREYAGTLPVHNTATVLTATMASIAQTTFAATDILHMPKKSSARGNDRQQQLAEGGREE